MSEQRIYYAVLWRAGCQPFVIDARMNPEALMRSTEVVRVQMEYPDALIKVHDVIITFDGGADDTGLRDPWKPPF